MNEAKTVRESRAVKRRKVGRGTGRGGMGEKSWVKRVSLWRQRARFAVEVVRNFRGPEVVVEAGREVRVEEVVSRVLAVR